MLDLGFVRGNLEVVEEKLRARGADPAALLGDFRKLDQSRREAITASEQLKARRNELSQQVATLKREGKDATAVMDETRALKDRLEELDKTATALDEQMRLSLAGIPNLTRDEVPTGKSEEDNVTVKTWGEKPQFDFDAEASLGTRRAARHSRPRSVQPSSAARASPCIWVQEHASSVRSSASCSTRTPRSTATPKSCRPSWSTPRVCFGTGQLPKFAEDLFRCSDADAEAVARGEFKDNDHWLIPTAEVPVTNLYRDEILDEARLPIRLTAYTPCFRAEAGAAGKDTRGIIRQHQFQKVELVKFTRPDESDAEHERLTRDAEEILEALKLPYRRVLLCTADTGFSSAKTFDLEVWLPGQQLYREISSCSNFEGFQARRANIRFKPSAKGKNEFVHTLNGSGLAVGRTWLAILENYQQADGSVVVPEALRPYMGGLERITAQEQK